MVNSMGLSLGWRVPCANHLRVQSSEPDSDGAEVSFRCYLATYEPDRK